MELNKDKGEIICPKCKGSGNQADWMHLPDYRAYMECSHCNGEGKLDWIENVVGKKPEDKVFRLRYDWGFKLISGHNNIINTVVS